MKFGIQEGQLLLFLDTKFSLVPVQSAISIYKEFLTF